MNQTKPWYSSTGVWGSVATMIVGFVSLFHLHPDAQWTGDATSWLVTLGTLIGGAISLWGRIRATKQISSVPATTKVLALGLMLFPLTMISGCQNSAATTQPGQASLPDPTARLTLATQGATFTLNTIANARDAGLITQATLTSWKPEVDAFVAARNKARQQLAANSTATFEDAIVQLTAAYAQLQPLLAKIPAAAKPVIGPPAPSTQSGG